MTHRFRKREFLKRVLEFLLSSITMYALIEQYAIPILQTALATNITAHPLIMIERVLKLSVVSVLIWLLMFYAFFHSLLNAVAEIMRFGDRRFYMPWWNAVL